MSANVGAQLARIQSRLQATLRMYATRRHALLLALALIHLGLLVVAGLLTSTQIESSRLQVLVAMLLGTIALVVVFSPGSAAALVFIIGCGIAYLVLSAMQSSIGEVHTLRLYDVLGLAAALFLVHAVDSLREALPADATIEAAVVMIWVRRVAEALVPGLLLGAFLLVLPTASAGGAFWLVGAIGVLLAVGLPAIALRPRPWRDQAEPDQ